MNAVTTIRRPPKRPEVVASPKKGPKTLAAVVATAPAQHRVVRDAAFAKRLESAVDGHPHSPEKHFGRLRWLQEQLAKAGEHVSAETCRKWFEGEARPRPIKMLKLAQALEVDPAWLSMGIDPVLQPHERKVRNATVDGAVNLVAGFIQMDGGYPAFPQEGDRRAQEDNVDLHAIIRGASYNIHVALGEKEGKLLSFTIPSPYENVCVLGVIRDAGFRIQIYELSNDLIREHGKHRGGSVDLQVEIGQQGLRKIDSFSKRL